MTSLILALLLTIAVPSDGPIVPLLLDGTAIAGLTEPASAYAVELNDDGSWVLMGKAGDVDFTMNEGGLLSVAGDPLLPLPGSLFYDYSRLAIDGTRVRSVTEYNAPFQFDHHVFVDDVLLLRHGALSALGTLYSDPEVKAISGGGSALVWDQAAGKTLRRVDFTPTGVLLNETVLAGTNVLAPWDPSGTLFTTVLLSFADSYAMNSSGQAVFWARTSDNSRWVVKNDVAIAREGDAAPLPGYQWTSLSNPKVAINDAGQVALLGYIGQPGSNSKGALFVDDRYVLGHGDTVPGFTGTVLSIQPRQLAVDALGRALHVTTLGVAQNSVDAFFREQEPFVREGVTGWDGAIFTEVLNGTPHSFSRNGRWLAFRATLSDGRAGFFRADVDALLESTWEVDPDTGIAGGLGTPTLLGDGLLSAGECYSVTVADGPPGAGLHLVLGLTQLSQPFKGGVLVPTPDVILSGLSLDPNGEWSLVSDWPTGIPSGAPLWMQAWIQDGSAPQGYAASHGLSVSTD